MVFNATFNNIAGISWRSVLLDPEKTTDFSQVTDKFYHIMFYTSPWSKFELTTSMVIDTDYIGSCKSNYYTITATTAPTCTRSIFCNQQKQIEYFVLHDFIGNVAWNRKTARFLSSIVCTTKTGRHDIAEILLKVALITKTQSINQSFVCIVVVGWTQSDNQIEHLGTACK